MIQQWLGVILFSAFVVLPALFSTVQKTDSEQTSRDERRPALRIALSEFADSKHELNRCVKCVSVSFVEDDLLALTLATSVSPSRAQAGKVASPSAPIPFRTFLLDARTGKLRATQDWSSATSSFQIVPTHDGRFLVDASGEIRLFSSSFELLGRRRLPPNGPGSTFSHAIVSWSGHRVIIESYADRQIQLELLDADSLQAMHSWATAGPVINITAAENAVAIETHNQVLLAKVDEPWRAIYSIPEPRSCANQFMGPEFIGNDRLAFRDCENRLVGVDTSGKLLFKDQPFAPHTDIVTITASRDGHLFGALVYKSFCDASWFECLFDRILGAAPDRAIIYETLEGRHICETRLAGDRKHPLGEIALSPHGSLLAAMYGARSGRLDGIVEVLDLQAFEGPKLP